MKNFWNHLYVAGLLLMAVACSCDEVETSSPETSQGLRITASLRSLRSRATGGVSMMNEKGFGENDTIGLFSSGGNLDADSDGKLVNIPMKFDHSQGQNGYVFVNEEINADVNNLGEVYLYYPYRKGIESEEGASVIDPVNGRVFDFLHAQQDYGAGYAFFHSFCQLKIKCGEGFDKVPEGKQKVTVRLDKAADKMRIIDNNPRGGKGKDFELIGSQKDFETWQEKDANGIPVYTVILPCFELYYNSSNWTTYFIKVDYITLYDNDGNLQKLYLSHDLFEDDSHEDRGALKPGRIFPFTVQMENLKPVVRGGNILSWDTYEDITVSREYGIYESSQFDDWRLKYNEFVTEYATKERPSSEEIKGHPLLRYGRYINKRWNFYLAEDIDLSSLPASTTSAYIIHLCDTLSGANHTLSNISLQSSIGNTGFVGIISEGGCIQDVRFSSFFVDNFATTSNALCGTIAAQMTGGTVTNCRVTGISIHCNSDVFTGIFAGDMTGGTIEYSTFQGAVMGGKSEATGIYQNIIGKHPNPPAGGEQPKVDNVDVTNMIINNSK